MVARARKMAGEQLAAWGLAEAVFATVLIVSELVMNAIRYGDRPHRATAQHVRVGPQAVTAVDPARVQGQLPKRELSVSTPPGNRTWPGGRSCP
ncbi:hypothetical protein [Streptomyces sp. A012304]|uniref:hypothetical protein n=1 Tax=Streptomyces sp. A012304 TaxID=375446 RepID=UPI002801BCA2|nr:hypothetical protein ALMP_55570 [Streptomyces sp. A012304]